MGYLLNWGSDKVSYLPEVIEPFSRRHSNPSDFSSWHFPSMQKAGWKHSGHVKGNDQAGRGANSQQTAIGRIKSEWGREVVVTRESYRKKWPGLWAWVIFGRWKQKVGDGMSSWRNSMSKILKVEVWYKSGELWVVSNIRRMGWMVQKVGDQTVDGNALYAQGFI